MTIRPRRRGPQLPCHQHLILKTRHALTCNVQANRCFTQNLACPFGWLGLWLWDQCRPIYRKVCISSVPFKEHSSHFMVHRVTVALSFGWEILLQAAQYGILLFRRVDNVYCGIANCLAISDFCPPPFFHLTYLLNFMLQCHTLPCMHRCFHVHLTVTKRTQSAHTTSRAHTDLAQQMRTCVFQTLMEKT